MKNFGKLLLLSLAALLYSCGQPSDDAAKIEYFPFQSEKDGRWGMMSPEGDVLFEGEFSNCPTVAMNGRFMVKNADGLWEIYTTDEKPKQVGGQYLSVSAFREDVTAAVEKNKPVVLINRDGEVVKELAKLNGKAVASVGRFSEGLAQYETVDGLVGMIDTDGDVVIDAQYLKMGNCSDGRVLAVDKKYKDSDKDKAKLTVLSKSGKVISEIGLSKFSEVGEAFYEGVCMAEIKADGDRSQGLIDEKGEWKLKASSKVKRMSEVKDGKFVFYNGDSYGVMNLKGEQILRPKYDNLYFGADDVLVAYDRSAGNAESFRLINLKGEDVGKEKFALIYPFFGSGLKHAVVKISDHEYGIINRKGELKELKNTDICGVAFETGNDRVESDFVDIGAFVEAIGITKDGIDGAKLTMTPEQAVKFSASKETSKSTEPQSYTYTSTVGYNREVKPSSLYVEMGFAGYMAKYEGYYSGSTSHNYHFTAEKMRYVSAGVSIYGKFDGKGKDLFKAISDKLLTLGKRINGNDNCLVVDLGAGRYAVVGIKDSALGIGVFNGDGKKYDISSFGAAGATFEEEKPAAAQSDSSAGGEPFEPEPDSDENDEIAY